MKRLLAVIALSAGYVHSADAQLNAERASATSHADALPVHQAGDAFELRVVGPTGQPVPHASVEIRARPAPEAEQVRVGAFSRMGSYGTFVTTDEEGRLVVELPESFSLSIRQPGFGPYWAGWGSRGNPQPVPSKFTAELDAAWSVGGIVVDQDGKPVQGVSVSPSIQFKKRPGDVQELGVGTQSTTDAAGKWRYDNVPDTMSEVFVEINHPEFMSLRRALPRSGFGLEEGEQPAERIPLDRGLSVAGVVTDDVGQPIKGALIRTQFLNDLREATTDEKGVYKLYGCEPRMTRIVVSARGRAMDLQEVRVEPDLAPVNFQLPPGGTIRVHVLDEQGAPIPRTRIFFQRWRGRIDYFEFDHVNQYTDEHGVWEWNEAPLDEIHADISAPGRMQLSEEPLIARDEVFIFHPPPPLVISGNVVDAETGEPVKAFRVVWGIRSTPEHMNWVPNEAIHATDGHYVMRQNYGYLAHLVRIEADGYQAAVSREIASDEGNVQIDFRLTRAANVAATVLTPDGEPAAGAKVALGVADSQITVKNGDIHDRSTYATRQDTDEAGRFSFPPPVGPFHLIITHPAGFIHVEPADDPPVDKITLTPWARVEGTFRVGPGRVANAPITLNTSAIYASGQDSPNVSAQYEVTTGEDGQFAFDRVFPGQARIGRRILLMVGEGATEVTSSRMESIVLEAGQTTVVQLGGVGRPVIGKLAPPERHEGKVLWNFALLRVESNLPPAPDVPPDIPDAEELNRQWSQALNELRKASPYYTVSIDRDGAFRIDDVPPGTYKLSVRFQQDEVGVLTDYKFSVPLIEGGRSDDPLDLGVLTLE